MGFKLMNRNTEVLEFLYDEETHSIEKISKLLNSDYAPLGIFEYKTEISRKLFDKWWSDRAIPASRSNFKGILDDLDITNSVELLEKCFGLSLSDQYWIKEKSSTISWEHINFFTNPFSEDMGKLSMGQVAFSNSLNIFSPDNSSDGNLRKKWKIINGKRCLIKSGNSLNNQEPFNEIVATKLYERILAKDEYVPYFLIEENGVFYSACETMVGLNEELVSAYYIDKTQKVRSNDPLYEHYINACKELGIPDAKTKVNKMLICDYIIANHDRHYRNFGAIRNIVDLKWIGIAPIYDSGSSLWATTPTQQIGASYKGKPFKMDVQEQLKLVDDLSWFDQNKLAGFENDVIKILSHNPLLEEERILKIVSQLRFRIEHIISRKKELENKFDLRENKGK